MQTNSINTTVLQQFINQIKAADMSNQREIRLDIATAKNLSYTIALVMTRLAGNYEDLIKNQQKDSEAITIKMDGGNWDS